MSSASRKFKRNLEKKRKKNLKNSVKTMTERLTSLGDSCANCSAPFDKTNPQQMMEWMVYVVNDEPNLICPQCQSEIESRKKEMQKDEEGFKIHV